MTKKKKTYSSVEQVHLVDEQVTEHSGARHDDVDTGTAKLLQRDKLELVHAADGVGNGPNAGEAQDLGK